MRAATSGLRRFCSHSLRVARGIATDIPRNTGAVLAREIGRAKHLAIAVWLKTTVVDDREIIALHSFGPPSVVIMCQHQAWASLSKLRGTAVHPRHRPPPLRNAMSPHHYFFGIVSTDSRQPARSYQLTSVRRVAPIDSRPPSDIAAKGAARHLPELVDPHHSLGMPLTEHVPTVRP